MNFSASAPANGKGGEIMKITINGSPKEIAALALELQGQPKKCDTNNAVKKQIDLVSKASELCYNQNCFKDLSFLSYALKKLNS